MSELVSCVRAHTLLNQHPSDWGTERLPLHQVNGRTLAQPIIADRDQPPFHRVAMDGIAINYRTYAAGQRHYPSTRTQAAGQAPQPLTNPSECIEIMTGAALPPGCTTVIRYEDLTPTNGGFTLPDDITDDKNIHHRGKDTTVGTKLASPGQRIGPAEIGMLATFGYEQVDVKTLPRIAIISTGNELVSVDTKPAPYQIRRSNVHQLSALLQRHGYQASTHHLADDAAAMKLALEKTLRQHDVVILSGGVSKGKYDYVPSVLQQLGVEKIFHGVAQRPGKPMWAGRQKNGLVFGLPGNPQSSLSCCLTYVLSYLDRNLGLPEASSTAVLRHDLTFKPDLTLFAYVEVLNDPRTGHLIATPIRHAGSGDASSLLRGNAFLELPAGQNLYPAGNVYKFRYL